MHNHPFINIATTAARAASRILMSHFDRTSSLKPSEKKAHDLVSQVDLACESIIIQTIHKAYPDHAIIAEEQGHIGDHEVVWIIDPLDGTSNYLHGIPHFAISIAVTIKSVLEVGLIYDPINNELYTAIRGKGAFREQKRIRVRNQVPAQHAIIGTGFPFRHRDCLDDYLPQLKQILSQVHDCRRAGSAALDLAYTACGRLDGFWENHLAQWDFAAGMLMVQEAGGLVTDICNKARCLSSGSIVAASPEIHRLLIQNIRSATQSPFSSVSRDDHPA